MKLGDTVVIRTRLQALIVRSLIDAGIVRTPIHAIFLLRDDRHVLETGLQRPLERAGIIGRRTVRQRPRDGFIHLFFTFLAALVVTRRREANLYCSNFNWYPFALALRCLPGHRIRTFDDGTANIQERDNSFLSDAPSAQPGLRGVIARWLFPRGPAHFARSRIERHWTIYPKSKNVVPPDKLEVIHLDWAGLMVPGDLAQLPASASRIYLGTVYIEVRRVGLRNADEANTAMLMTWSDLYLPHPRDESAKRAPDHIRRTPAEAIIDHFAAKGPIVVAHHNSSAVLPFLDHPNVAAVDLCEHDLGELATHSEHSP